VTGAPADVLEDLRPTAFGIAYRMLGSVSEAEDVTQEALLRLHRLLDEGERIESPRAYLATVTTRLAIDELRSARARRESYVGEWLPEPLLSVADDDPARHAELADSLSLAFLVLLERLSPEQRAALLLHDVFDYRYDEVARIVGKSEAATRQLASRARRHVDDRRPRFQASPERQEELARRFLAAAREGEVEKLEALLAEDVELHGDGGGKAPALARPLRGRARAARTLLAWMRFSERLQIEIRPVEVNGRPGFMSFDAEGRVVAVMALDVGETAIEAIHSVVNPDKLRHVRPAGV
jgi:RNA polymerase sigma-70 factor (ECF subfamily)